MLVSLLRPHWRWAWIWMWLICCVAPSWSRADNAEDHVDFDRDVRPILSENCYQCHGPDGSARRADLRLDTREGLLSEDIVVAAQADESELFRRISTEVSDERMPPDDSGLRLTSAQVETIRMWIQQGAAWSDHWAFTRPLVPRLPVVAERGWPRNAIDYFVLARLESNAMSPSPEANREMLLRRLTMDLTGLPPTIEEVDEFAEDSSPDAYERLIDRLFASPRYGERMAWDWLDAARYADTDGFQGDPTRQPWPWRDWLIGALNANLPFDRFTVEVLAGDLLPQPTPEQFVATAFNRHHMFNGEGGRIPEETRVENVFDRTETTSAVWLGLTMTCARCHDHKFDPLTQAEYYRLYAFFNDTSETGRGGRGRTPPTIDYLPPDLRERRHALQTRLDSLSHQLDAADSSLDEAQAEWEADLRSRGGLAAGEVTMSQWAVLGPLPAPGGDSRRAFEDDLGPERGVDLDRTYSNGQHRWEIDTRLADGKVHPLSDVIGATYLYRSIESPGPRSIDVSLGSDDGIRVWLNGEPVLSNDVFRVAAPDQDKLTLGLRQGSNELLIKIVNRDGGAGFYFQKTGETIAGLPQRIARIVAEEKSRSSEQRVELRRFYREQLTSSGRELSEQMLVTKRQLEEINASMATVMVMDSLPPDQKRETFILSRGTYNQPREKVTAGTPAFLPPLPREAPRDRLSLARWLVDSANPLSARVTVNRYWQMFFGNGLVTTTEDFGRQGSRPSHPHLLDWLATQFVAGGWNVKALQRKIVSSATYRQTSGVSPDSLQRDPDCRLLSRSPRFRRPSWMLRDQAYAAAGLLSGTLGGPPVKPYQPEGIWAEATFGKIRYRPDSGESLYRRSLYIFWRRIVGPTMLFDSAKRQTCEVRPTRTNSPLHALTTLNEEGFLDAARGLARRVMAGPADSAEARAAQAFRIATSRRPTSDELSILVGRLESLTREYRRDLESAEQLLSAGGLPRDARWDPAEQAAYTALCNLLLNLDEVLTRE